MNRWEYYREMDRRRTFRRWAGMFNVIGAAVAVVCILVALGLLMNTVVSVALHPVGDAVIQLS